MEAGVSAIEKKSDDDQPEQGKGPAFGMLDEGAQWDVKDVGLLAGAKLLGVSADLLPVALGHGSGIKLQLRTLTVFLSERLSHAVPEFHERLDDAQL